jgi:hypothetical protein
MPLKAPLPLKDPCSELPTAFSVPNFPVANARSVLAIVTLALGCWKISLRKEKGGAGVAQEHGALKKKQTVLPSNPRTP